MARSVLIPGSSLLRTICFKVGASLAVLQGRDSGTVPHQGQSRHPLLRALTGENHVEPP
jgi:hypothetical protein